MLEISFIFIEFLQKNNKKVQKRPTDNSSKGFWEPIKSAENK